MVNYNALYNYPKKSLNTSFPTSLKSKVFKTIAPGRLMKLTSLKILSLSLVVYHVLSAQFRAAEHKSFPSV